MDFIPDINISDFDYQLPQSKIAQYPLEKRDESKLLIYQDQQISIDKFKSIPGFLANGGLLIYNETKVIQARLKFIKETGARIEIFCLEPFAPTKEIQQAFQEKSGVIWKCLVGNAKKWKSGILKKEFLYDGKSFYLRAKRIEQFSDYALIEFTWSSEILTFSEVLSNTGCTPLPPYMNREAVESDKNRYQTIYARSEGSVAAPTAGLHFTDIIIEQLKAKKISIENVTLHVGAGTFKPVSSEKIHQHEMHTEKIVMQKRTIQAILENIKGQIVVVGTTTMRTIESIYWFGVKLIVDKETSDFIDIQQWDPYNPLYNIDLSVTDSLKAILNYMESSNLTEISGQTQLIIVPGYKFKIPNVLITNFHMPKSTLLLLVSAFIGPGWEKAYQYAIENDFRFLSYGDSCLFFKQ
jgi:S-adenosylmethionine:tRNA ribosyltransferase-isomerase